MTRLLITAVAIFGWLVCYHLLGFEPTVIGLLACILLDRDRS